MSVTLTHLLSDPVSGQLWVRLRTDQALYQGQRCTACFAKRTVWRFLWRDLLCALFVFLPLLCTKLRATVPELEQWPTCFGMTSCIMGRALGRTGSFDLFGLPLLTWSLYPLKELGWGRLRPPCSQPPVSGLEPLPNSGGCLESPQPLICTHLAFSLIQAVGRWETLEACLSGGLHSPWPEGQWSSLFLATPTWVHLPLADLWRGQGEQVMPQVLQALIVPIKMKQTFESSCLHLIYVPRTVSETLLW